MAESSDITSIVTAEQVRAAVEAAGVKWAEHHRCGCCNSPVGYRFQSGRPYFDSSCECCGWSSPQRIDWQDAADFINRHDQEHRAEVMKRFGL